MYNWDLKRPLMYAMSSTDGRIKFTYTVVHEVSDRFRCRYTFHRIMFCRHIEAISKLRENVFVVES